jgi:uncharacterized Fe-S cluster protein YjdI
MNLTMKKYPIGTILKRNVTKRYTTATVKGYKGKKVMLSFYGVNCDDTDLYDWNVKGIEAEFTIVSKPYILPEELFTL